MIEHQYKAEPALIVGLNSAEHAGDEHSLEELVGLAEAAGFGIADKTLVKVRDIAPRYYMGPGKADEVCAMADACDAEVIAIDVPLTPSPQRNWERLSRKPVIDRHGIILEIFASRARTSEAMLQVERARLEYQLPRLQNAWTHLSRQRGGARGTRGEGEKQLEMDRRQVLHRISRIDAELAHLRTHRATTQKRRKQGAVPSVALVAYTNAGKSSLLHRLTEADVHVADQLFATLDPTTRKCELPSGTEIVISDTVGFIEGLPHDLVEAFKTTLDEVRDADLILHVMDAASPDRDRYRRVTLDVLSELEAAEIPRIEVMNKIDTLDSTEPLLNADATVCEVSALTGTGISELLAMVDELLHAEYVEATYRIPSSRYDLAAMAYRRGKILDRHQDGDHIVLNAQLPSGAADTLAAYRE